LLIQQIADDVHYTVALMECYGMTDTPAYKELTQFAIAIDQYKLVRYSPDAPRYAIALLERLLAIVGHPSQARPANDRAGDMIAYLEEHIATLSAQILKFQLTAAATN
jgi:hypothetical protein